MLTPWILAAAAVIGPGLVFVAFVCWVLRLFDHASELRTQELEQIMRGGREAETL